jgi:hypothetical protein
VPRLQIYRVWKERFHTRVHKNTQIRRHLPGAFTSPFPLIPEHVPIPSRNRTTPPEIPIPRILIKVSQTLSDQTDNRESEQLPTKAQLDEAQRVRKRLLDLFAQYDAVSKRILQAPSTSPTDVRVQTAMNHAATHFLQANMLPLQSLPKILKGKEKSPLAGNGVENGLSEGKEKELKEKMMVLEEQKYLVENMIERAQKGRRVEEVEALRESMGDLETEIGRIRVELGDLFIE